MADLATTNVKTTAVRSFFEGINLINDDYRLFTNYHQENAGKLQIAALTGIGNIPDWDGSADITPASISSPGTNGLSLSYQGYGVNVKLPKYDIMDVPGIVEKTSRKLGQAVGYKYQQLAFASVAASFTTTIVDGENLCSANHKIESGSVRSVGGNALSTALDRSALAAALSAMRLFPNFQGQFTNFADLPLVLIVPPALEETAIEVLGSSLSGADNQINMFAGRRISLVVSPLLSDTDDWFLCTGVTEESPYQLWERSAPMYTIREDQDNRQLKIAVDFALATGLGPQPDGVVGSSV